MSGQVAQVRYSQRPPVRTTIKINAAWRPTQADLGGKVKDKAGPPAGVGDAGDEVNVMRELLGGTGARHPVSPVKLGVDLKTLPKGWRYGLVWDSQWPLAEGETAVPNPTDHRYYVREARFIGAFSATEKAKLIETDYDVNRPGSWVMVTNFGERPRAFSATETINGSHHLRKGMAVIYWPEVTPGGQVLWVMNIVPKFFMYAAVGQNFTKGAYDLKLYKGACGTTFSAHLFASDLGESPSIVDAIGLYLPDIGPSGEATSHCITTFPRYGVGEPIGVTAGGVTIIAMTMVATPGDVFVVNLTKNGGEDGGIDDETDAPIYASWTYDVKDLAGHVLLTAEAVERPRTHPGTTTPATKGYAYFDLGGTLKLAEAWEQFGAIKEDCD